MDYQNICEQVCLLARKVGVWLWSERQRLDTVNMEAKGVHDYVTQFDGENYRGPPEGTGARGWLYCRGEDRDRAGRALQLDCRSA